MCSFHLVPWVFTSFFCFFRKAFRTFFVCSSVFLFLSAPDIFSFSQNKSSSFFCCLIQLKRYPFRGIHCPIWAKKYHRPAYGDGRNFRTKHSFFRQERKLLPFRSVTMWYASFSASPPNNRPWLSELSIVSLPFLLIVFHRWVGYLQSASRPASPGSVKQL